MADTFKQFVSAALQAVRNVSNTRLPYSCYVIQKQVSMSPEMTFYWIQEIDQWIQELTRLWATP